MTRTNQLCQPTPLPALFAPRFEKQPHTLLTRVFIALQRWRYHGRMRRELLTLDERMLRDIGLTRSDVEHAVSEPYWRVLANNESRHRF